MSPDFIEYVRVQSEAALRGLATRYPHDVHDEEKTSLRGSTALVAEQLQKEVEERVEAAGVHLDEERKAAMVSNLLVVLCGDRSPHPVINAGTLY